MKHSQKRTFMDIEKMSSDEFKAFCRLGNKNHCTKTLARRLALST